MLAGARAGLLVDAAEFEVELVIVALLELVPVVASALESVPIVPVELGSEVEFVTEVGSELVVEPAESEPVAGPALGGVVATVVGRLPKPAL